MTAHLWDDADPARGIPSAPEPLAPDDPRVIGPFLLRGRLGAGGMGVVYLGDSPGQPTVAVKVIRADMASDQAFRRRFEREVTAMGRVRSRFTAPLIAADVDAPRPWLATAYVDGPTLRDNVSHGGPLPAGGVLTLADGITRALLAIHGAGVVHRDLKPANVLLAVDGPRVIDFGIARAAGLAGHTTVGRIVGSPAYMSPEQVRGEPVGAPSDVFSLGSVLAFAATGRNAFGKGNTAELLYRVVREEPQLTGISDGLRGLIEACLRKAPHQRPTLEAVLAHCRGQRVAGWGDNDSNRGQTTTHLPMQAGPTISPRPSEPSTFEPSTFEPSALEPVTANPAAAVPVTAGAAPGTRTRWSSRNLAIACCALAFAGAVAASPARTLFRPWELRPEQGGEADVPPARPGPADQQASAEATRRSAPDAGRPTGTHLQSPTAASANRGPGSVSVLAPGRPSTSPNTDDHSRGGDRRDGGSQTPPADPPHRTGPPWVITWPPLSGPGSWSGPERPSPTSPGSVTPTHPGPDPPAGTATPHPTSTPEPTSGPRPGPGSPPAEPPANVPANPPEE